MFSPRFSWDEPYPLHGQENTILVTDASVFSSMFSMSFHPP